MTKFLTPARLCTLILIEVYQRHDFWTYNADTSGAVLGLIAGQCLQLPDLAVSGLEQATTLPRNVLEFAKPLASLQADVPGRSWLSTLVRELWEVHTVDELHDLFDRCMELLVPILSNEQSQEDLIKRKTITRASPMGQFIRRSNVEFTRLQFSESLSLWNSFVAYREPSRDIWTQQHPDAARSALLESIHNLDVREASLHLSDSALVGTDTVDTVLSASVLQLQKLGQRIPGPVKVKLEQWLTEQQTSKTQSLHHFMSFFDAWRAGQYSLALENLHRYFDYSVAKGSGDDMKVYYQYALLHLSVLHADFEHWDESVSAMKECIATARENQDTACLNFALSWLLYLRQSRHTRSSTGLRSLAAIAGEGGSEQDEIAFLKAKARDSKHWTLMSSALLEEAKFELRHHGICAKAVESVLQSSYLNVQHASLSMIPATAVFQAAIFDRLGQAHLSNSHHQSVLSVYTQHCSLADSTRITCRLAYNTAQRGHYAKSLAILRDFRPTVAGTIKLEQRLTTFAELLDLMRAVRRADLQAAEYHMVNLRPLRDTADPDITALADQLEIGLLTKQNRLDVALTKINSSLERSRVHDDGDVAETVTLLIQKANVFAAAGRAPRGFSIALRAVSTAQRCRLVGLFVEAINVLGCILNELTEYDAARKLCEAALPHALEGSNSLVAAQLFVTLGEAHVGLLSAIDDPGTKQTQLAHQASAHIERAREIYEEIEEYDGQLDCLLMQSKLARWADDEKSAEHADAKYHQLVVEQQAHRC